MAGVTKEQIEAAKQVDILDYLTRHEWNNLKQERQDRHTLRDHDSFVISNGKWCWFSRGFGCNKATALNYLIKVRDYSFVDAVLTLQADAPVSYQSDPEQAKPPPSKKPFAIPPRNKDNMRVIAYLQSRGIDKALIMDCVNRGALYESAKYHSCVFTGKTEDGRTRFACLRSTTARFRQDIEGSDKRYGFILPPDNPNSPNLACFESPIDALSHQTMCKQGYIRIPAKSQDFVGEGGATERNGCPPQGGRSEAESATTWDGWRLSLSGGSLSALVYFLERHPEITRISVCTDADAAGQKAAEKIRALPREDERFAAIAVEVTPPLAGNDYNDELLSLQKRERAANRTHQGAQQCL